MKASPEPLGLPQRGKHLLGKHLLGKLLTANPDARVSAREALRDPWFDPLSLETSERGRMVISAELLNHLRTFKRKSGFSKEVIRLLVMLHDDDPAVLKLKDAFFYLDLLNNGVIGKKEIKKIFVDLKQEVTDKELGDIIQSLELRTNNVITYTEFVAGLIDSSFFTNDEYLEEAFTRFDIDKDGVISFTDIVDCFSRFGIALKDDHLAKLTNELIIAERGKISKEEFWTIMEANSTCDVSPKFSKQSTTEPFKPLE